VTATSRDLSPAQTSAAMVATARQVTTVLAGYKTAARTPGGWDEHACALGRLQGTAQQIASLVNYGGYAASDAMTGIPGTLPGWIQSTTHAAAREIQDGANHLRAYRGLQQATARAVKPLRVLHAAGDATEVLYDLLVRKSGTYRLRPGDAPAFTELLQQCCAELAGALAAEARYARPVLGDDPAEALVYAGQQAGRARRALGPVVRNIKADIAALPPRSRIPGKVRTLRNAT
jgi:hypothetical protein